MSAAEALARKLAAQAMGLVNDPDGLKLPDDLWRQKLSKIVTVHDPKPGRVDGPEPFPWDWEARSDEYDEGDPVGYGPTEAEAIRDLMAQIEERQE